MQFLIASLCSEWDHTNVPGSMDDNCVPGVCKNSSLCGYDVRIVSVFIFFIGFNVDHRYFFSIRLGIASALFGFALVCGCDLDVCVGVVCVYPRYEEAGYVLIVFVYS